MTQKFTADTTAFVAAVDLASEAVAKLADACANAVEAVDLLGAALDDTAKSAREAAAAVEELQAAIDGLHGKDVHVGVDVAGAGAGAAAAGAAAGVGDLAGAEAILAHELPDISADLMMQTQLLQDMRDQATLGTAALLAFTAGARDSAAGTAEAAGAARNATRVYGGFWGALNLVRGANIGLFAGVLGTVGGLHLLADAVAEVVAVVVPAAIAFAAFGIAAAPTVQDIATQMKDLFTVTQATSQSVYPMTGAFQSVAAAVRPQVYQLFGEALGVVTKNMGVFQKLATGTGTVLDQLGARLEVALTSGHGFSIFLSNATTDLAKLGDIAGNVGGILGNFLKAVPGYAQYFLNFADAASRVGEAITGSGIVQGVMKFGLAAHGAVIYTGLLATAAVRLLTGFGRFPGILSLASSALGAGASAAARLAGEGNAAERAMGTLSSRLSMAQALPWGWITLGAVALGVLAYKFITAKDAADSFITSFNQKLGTSPLAQVTTDIASGLTVMNSRMADAKTQMDQFSTAGLAVGKVLAPVAPGLMDAGNWFTKFSDSINGAINSLLGFNAFQTNANANLSKSAAGAAQAVHDYQAYASEIRTLNQQSVTFHTHLGELATAFGGTAAAMGILNAAGITANQMMDKSVKSWAQVIVQVQATINAYRAMGQQAGVLGADMNAMSIAGSDQVTSMAKLNQAFDTTIGIVSGGQTAFVGFEQAIGQGTKSIAGVAATAAVAGASMNGLNTQSLALRSAWQGAFTSGSQVVDALRMMISVSPNAASQNRNLTQSVKDVIAQLGAEGNKSAATRAELVALAQEVNPNIKNFSQLTQWLGKTGNAGADLGKRLAAMGIDIQALSTDAAALSGAVQQHVVNAFSLAKMAANGTDTAIKNLAQAMGSSGSAAAAAQAKLALFKVLVDKDGYSAQAAAALVSALTGQIYKIPTGHHTSITVDTAAAFSAVNTWLGTLARIPRSITTYLNIVQSGPGRVARAGGYAAGTPSAAPGLAMVGERGPELVAFGGGERVYSAPQTSHVLAALSAAQSAGSGGAPGEIHVHSHAYLDGKQVFENVKVHAYSYQTMNSGSRTGLLVPGNKIGSF